MRYKIDRFEENYAVVELDDMSTVNVDRRALPKDAQEGDVVEVLIDREATQEGWKETESLMDRIVRKRQVQEFDD